MGDLDSFWIWVKKSIYNIKRKTVVFKSTPYDKLYDNIEIFDKIVISIELYEYFSKIVLTKYMPMDQVFGLCNQIDID